MDIKFDSDQVAERGYLTSWNISSINGTVWSGYTPSDLYDALRDAINVYGLERMTDLSKKVILIYIDRLDKIRGFFRDAITEDDGMALTIMDLIEIREWTPWISEADVNAMQEIVNNTFIPENYFYITPN